MILSDGDRLYLGHRQEGIVEEPGARWAAPFIDLEKVFYYEPLGKGERLPSRERDLILGTAREKMDTTFTNFYTHLNTLILSFSFAHVALSVNSVLH